MASQYQQVQPMAPCHDQQYNYQVPSNATVDGMTTSDYTQSENENNYNVATLDDTSYGKKKKNTGLIIGISIGLVLLIGAIVFIIILCSRPYSFEAKCKDVLANCNSMNLNQSEQCTNAIKAARDDYHLDAQKDYPGDNASDQKKLDFATCISYVIVGGAVPQLNNMIPNINLNDMK